jgi:hypothetical protein
MRNPNVEIKTNLSKLTEGSSRFGGLKSIHAMQGDDEDTAILTATNGKAMAIVKSLGHIPSEQALAIPAKIADRGKTKADKSIKLDGETWSDGKKIEDAERGNFPNARDAVENSGTLDGYKTVVIDVDQLALLMDAVAHRSGGRKVKLSIKDNNHQVIVHGDGNAGVLMTCTIDERKLNLDEYKETIGEFKRSWDRCHTPTQLQSKVAGE